MKFNIEGITEQSGIYAGQEEYDIQVKNNTRLKGAVIDSQAEKEKNRITTGTLTWENIDNKVEYKASKRGLLPPIVHQRKHSHNRPIRSEL